MSLTKRQRRLVITAGVIAAYAASTWWAINQGYSFGRNVVVRCQQGHLFTTVWIPGASIKSLRLGLWRVQWCPVGRHVTLVSLVKNADLTEEEREFAEEHHDIPIP